VSRQLSPRLPWATTPPREGYEGPSPMTRARWTGFLLPAAYVAPAPPWGAGAGLSRPPPLQGVVPGRNGRFGGIGAGIVPPSKGGA
jgi:hypothetical protein